MLRARMGPYSWSLAAVAAVCCRSLLQLLQQSYSGSCRCWRGSHLIAGHVDAGEGRDVAQLRKHGSHLIARNVELSERRKAPELRLAPPFLRQNLYFCTSKASKVSTGRHVMPFSATEMVCSNSKKPNNLRQYFYFCTSKASTFVLVSNSR
jgi:hypothetical protein